MARLVSGNFCFTTAHRNPYQGQSDPTISSEGVTLHTIDEELGKGAAIFYRKDEHFKKLYLLKHSNNIVLIVLQKL